MSPTLDTDLAAGTAVGEYRIDARLTAGGMGTVYSAHHPIIGKKAAVKVLKAQHSTDEKLIQRFIDEARAVNHIGHAHIVDIFAFGRLDDGRSYFVMEWLNGQSLKEALREGLGFLASVEILLQLCDALEAAHAKGIVHRDLKPDNVFLERTPEGGVSVKLLDFGIAKLGDSIRRPTGLDTQPDLVMGTPDYISPEQASGHETTPASDVYSLGVMAYELFLGARPFLGDNPIDVMIKHISKEPPAPRTIAPNVPDALDHLLLRLIDKQPERRPSLKALQTTLRQMGVAAQVCAQPRRPTDRPVLTRSADSVAALLRALLSELNAGAAWVSADNEAPPVGTPVVMRFRSDRVAFELDLDAVVGGVFGAREDRVLVRYDRVSKALLDRVVEFASESMRDGGDRIEASWGRAAATKPSWADFLSKTPRRAESEDLPTELEVGPSGTSSVASASEPATPAPSAALPRASFGLGPKMMALTVTVVLLAVVAVTFVALRQSRLDRAFYVQDQNLTTARALSQGLERQFRVWDRQLRLTLATDAYEGPVGEFEQLAVCAQKRCRSVLGAQVPDSILSPMFDRAIAGTSEPGLGAVPTPRGLVVAAGSPERWAVGIADPAQLAFLGLPAPDVDVALVGPTGPTLSRYGPGKAHDLDAHPIVQIARSAPAAFGAKGYDAPDGTPYLGAWSRVEDLAVVVVSPLRVTEEQIQVLARQVLIVASSVLVLGVALAFLLSATTTRRIRRLTRNARRIALGDFTEEPLTRGRDEVAALGRYFAEMTRALRQRDEQVLEAQKVMNADEVRSVQKSLAHWLERDLASRLESIRALSGEGPHADRLARLAEEASNSLQSALLFASTGRARNDLVTIVRDAADRSPRGKLKIVNAALLPWLDADESQLREMIFGLFDGLAEAGRFEAELARDGPHLLLILRSGASEEHRKALAGTWSRIAREQGGALRPTTEGLVLRFQASEASE